jgi:hypothetical protein
MTIIRTFFPVIGLCLWENRKQCSAERELKIIMRIENIRFCDTTPFLFLFFELRASHLQSRQALHSWSHTKHLMEKRQDLQQMF